LKIILSEIINRFILCNLGTGKTLAFAIPMIQKWGKDPYGVFGLIMTPTRELALQIKDQIQFVGGDRAKVCLVIGGVDFQLQAIELYSKPSFVVATPGR
jgi:ATP-dependent RNA helicase DDX49/DBP8